MATAKKKAVKSPAKTTKAKKKAATHVVKPAADLVADTAEGFRKKLKTAVKKKMPELVLDFTKVETVDSIGLGVVMAAHNTMDQKGGKLKVINVSDDLVQLFKTMRLDHHVELQPAS